jgi:hypothetical protein
MKYAYAYVLTCVVYPLWLMATWQEPKKEEPKYVPEYVCDCGARDLKRWNDPERLTLITINGTL